MLFSKTKKEVKMQVHVSPLTLNGMSCHTEHKPGSQLFTRATHMARVNIIYNR